MAYIAYLFLCFLISFVLSNCGYGLDSWQWWAGCVCVWFSYLCGWIKGNEEK